MKLDILAERWAEHFLA